jgi:anaerobic selenocysteine-containing dehydrogenase
MPRVKAGDEGDETDVGRAESGRWMSSVCLQCDAGCGIRVRVVEGRVVKIEGNPLFPTNRGRICPKGQAGLQVLYDPDRIKAPLKRVGERGSGQWQRIPWPEALAMVVGKLKGIRDAGEPHTLAIMGARYRGQMHPLMARFLEAFGSPNDIASGLIGVEGMIQAHYLTQGIGELMGCDLAHTSYLLSFGTAFAEAARPTVENARLLGEMKQGKPGVRAKIVQVEPRLSVSAAKADEWIPIIPGTDGALALGIAHVIVKEELYDKEYVARHTFGFEDWKDSTGQGHLGFRTILLEDYPPQAVSSITGIPPETIVRLAREFAAYRPSLATAGRGSVGHSNGTFTGMAIHSLNALVGSIGARGGILPQEPVPLAKLPAVKLDEVARRGRAMPRLDSAGTPRFPLASNVSQAVPQSIISGEPYVPRVLFLYYTDPLFSRPDVEKSYEAWAKVPFIVSFSPFMDDSSQQADLILPDSTYLERWQDDIPLTSSGFPLLGLRQPVVEPLYDTANTGDVIIRVAQDLGGTVADSFPWNSFQEMLQERIKGVYRAGRGSIVASSWPEFWGQLVERGGWWDTSPPSSREPLATPSGKFEFSSQTLRKRLEGIAQGPQRLEGTLSRLKIEARGDRAFLPHYEPPRPVAEEREFPFFLNTYKTMTLAQGRGANQPWLLEIYGLQLMRKWDSWVEINPETARELGIADGDQVWVESPLGRIRVSARLYPGAMPEVLNMPIGFGHRAYGRWAKDRGANPNMIIANEYEHLGGLVAWSSTRVRIYK